ncbi:MAG TPA: hypothetical protein VGG64_04525 [Pirellulales bacterium]|jgi:hypothetical protein|nr:hypothetical protein [Pirellulales bacterium]
MTRFDQAAVNGAARCQENAQRRLGTTILLYVVAVLSTWVAVLWPAASILAVIGFGYLAIRWCLFDLDAQGQPAPEWLTFGWPVWPIVVAAYLLGYHGIRGVKLAIAHSAGLAAAGLIGLCLGGYSPLGWVGHTVTNGVLLLAMVASVVLFLLGVQRRYPKAILLAVVLAAPVCLAATWRFAADASSREWMRKITGVEFALGSPGHWYDTGPSFNGDGYIIEEYRLSPEVAERFLKFLPEMADRPKLWPSSGDRHVEHWKTGRPGKADIPYINFALHANIYSIGGPSLVGQEADAQAMQTRALKSLEKSTTHFAYFYKAGSSSGGQLWVQNVLLYIIDARANRLYRIDFDT